MTKNTKIIVAAVSGAALLGIVAIIGLALIGRAVVNKNQVSTSDSSSQQASTQQSNASNAKNVFDGKGKNACETLPSSEVAAVMGAPAVVYKPENFNNGAPQIASSTTDSQCYYKINNDIVNVSFRLKLTGSLKQPTGVKSNYESIKKSNREAASYEQINGIGEDAYYSEAGDTIYGFANNMSYSIAVRGSSDDAGARKQAETLARAIVAKF